VPQNNRYTLEVERKSTTPLQMQSTLASEGPAEMAEMLLFIGFIIAKHI
jgi:hypothetical protein